MREDSVSQLFLEKEAGQESCDYTNVRLRKYTISEKVIKRTL